MDKVLFADEECARLGPFIDALQTPDREVVLANDASEAVRLAKEHAKDLVLIVMDLMMPKGPDAPPDLDEHRSGVWAVERIRGEEELAHVPIIVLSGVSQRRVTDGTRTPGWALYLEKPVRLPDFLSAVQRHALKKGGST